MKRIAEDDPGRLALRRVIKARSTLLLDEQFFGFLALKLKLKIDPTCRTFWTDGVHIGFNPKYVLERTFDENIALVCEEVMHNAHGHSWRRDGRDPREWNKDCDYAIMPILIAAKMKIPADSCYDPKYKGKSAEWIYAERAKERQKEREKQKQEEQEEREFLGGDFPIPVKASGEEDNEDDDMPPDNPGDEPEETEGEPSDEPNNGSGDGDEESEDQDQPGQESADDQNGKPSEKESKPQKPKTPMSGGEVREPSEDVDIQELENDWEVAVIQAVQMAKAAGKLPAGLERLVESIADPRIPWNETLRKLVQQMVARADFSFRRPNRRYISQGFYMPEMRSERMPAGVIYWDTSGSRDDQKSRAECAAECLAVIDECRPERLFIIYGDDEVANVQEFEPDDIVKFEPKGGGGTDFRPIFDYIEEQQIEPAWFIGITDLMGPFPDKAPADYPVIWCASTNLNPPFGDTVRINDADKEC